MEGAKTELLVRGDDAAERSGSYHACGRRLRVNAQTGLPVDRSRLMT